MYTGPWEEVGNKTQARSPFNRNVPFVIYYKSDCLEQAVAFIINNINTVLLLCCDQLTEVHSQL